DSVAFVYTPCTVGVQPIADLNSGNISVYPNPAILQVTVTFKTTNGGNYTIGMVDVLGRTILEEAGKAVAGSNSHIINTYGLAKGVYMITVQKGNDTFKTKIVVN